MGRADFQRFLKLLTTTAISPILYAGALTPVGAAEDDGLIEGGKINFFSRARYETVSQDGFDRNADLFSWKNRLTITSGKESGFQVSGEVESIIHPGGGDHANTTRNGLTGFPVIADPKETEVNQLWIAYTGVEDLAIKVGRQRINLGDQRFVGGVGWRQNEQTFDAVRVDTTALPDARLTYIYLDKVNRLFGNDSPIGVFKGESHLFDGDFKGIKGLALSAYAYFLDLEQAPALSTKTIGFRAAGNTELAALGKLNYGIEWAHQTDYQLNPGDYGLDFYRGHVGFAASGFAGTISYEVLEGDGTRGFTTPLATLHKFQGFADVFLGTPASGIEDLNFTVSYTIKDAGPLENLKFQAWYHDYSAELGSGSLGDEIDLAVSAKLPHGFSALVKYADYSGDSFAASRDKLWLQLQFSY